MGERSKIDKLTREIERLEIKIERYEDKLDDYKAQMRRKQITKATFQKKKQLISDHIRGLRGTIHRKEKARQTFERQLREKDDED